MMFKGILPRRVVPPEFSMITPGEIDPEAGKENHPDPPSSKPTKSRRAVSASRLKDVPMEDVNTDQAFDRLLDEMQIPSTLRPKLANMDATVKAAMLKSSQVMTIKMPGMPSTSPNTPKGIRRTRSSDSVVSPRSSSDLPQPVHGPGKGEDTQPSFGPPNSLRFPSFHARGVSVDAARFFSQGSDIIATDLAPPKRGKEKEKGTSKTPSPARFFGILSGTSSITLEVETIKKLRLMLRNESASWSEEFLRLGGYSALLTRLNEILDVEWREEQHDDKVLHELLRCFKALSTSSIGCFALRSSSPTPFVQLVSLLYSDKKPGDIATRQLIVELLQLLFELYPPPSLPTPSTPTSPRRLEAWDTPTTSTNLVQLPAPHTTLFSLLRALLLTPAPPPSEAPSIPISPHAFIESLHKPRIYKTYLGEMSDVCRDYFWVFCHGGNTIWVLAEVDDAKVEKPRAPGGMTGGVEFEAMTYMTTHLKLLNAIAKAAEDLNQPREHELSAYQFHSALFLSGIERIILIARKASTTYYPTLHLELSRYVAAVGRSGYEIPWNLSRVIGMPPPAMCKTAPGTPVRGGTAHAQRQQSGGSPMRQATAQPYTQGQVIDSPSRRVQQRQGQVPPERASRAKTRGDVPTLPSPKKIEPIRFD